MYTTRIFWTNHLSEEAGQARIKEMWAKADTVIGGQGRIEPEKQSGYPAWLQTILSRHFNYDHVNYSYFVTTGQQPWRSYRYANWLIVFLQTKGVWNRFKLWMSLILAGMPLFAARTFSCVFKLPPDHVEVAGHLRVIIFEDLTASEMDSMDWTH